MKRGSGAIVAFAAVAAALAFAPAALAGEAKVSRPGAYAGYSAERYTAWTREARYVPVRDGTKLAVTIYRPAENGRASARPHPVLFTFTPYHARTRRPDGSISASVEQNDRGRAMVDMTRYGYVVVSADVRGKGASFGKRRGMQDRTEALDGRDLVEWAAVQPWSDGNVGMWGCSYVGGSQYQVASTRPPHLKAIFPGCTEFDKYAFVSRGGLTAQFNTRIEDPVAEDAPTVPMDEDKDGAMLKAAVAQHADNTPMGPLWYGMPWRDSVSPLLGVPFWKEASVSTYRDELLQPGLAIYKWGNWKDEGSSQALVAQAALGGKLMMGGWGHCEPGTFDLFAEQLRFFDRYLKGIDNGIEREPPIYYYTIGAPAGREWRFADRWPLANEQRRALRLSAERSGSAPSANDGTMADAPAATGADRYTVTYEVACPAYPSMWPCPLDAKGLTYTTAPLTEDLQVTGTPILHLRIAASTPDADVFAYLEDIAPDGSADIVAHGRLKLSHRKLSPPPYPMGGALWRSGERKDTAPMTPGRAEAVLIDLLPTSKIFKAGHRLRLVITGADERQRNLSDIKQTPPPVLEVGLGGDDGSWLDLPVIPGGAET